MRAGASVNCMDCNGNTALHYAARFDRVDIALYLLARGARVNVRNRFGDTPLHCAVDLSKANPRSVCTLIDILRHGGSVFDINEDKHTPLDVAILYNNWPAVWTLVRHMRHDHTIVDDTPIKSSLDQRNAYITDRHARIRSMISMVSVILS